MVVWRYVTPGYFAALGVPIRRGRPFTPRDRDSGAFSIILSESLANIMFPAQDPIGHRILRGPQGEWFNVIGVAGDVSNGGASRRTDPEYYVVRKPVEDLTFRNQEPPLGWRSAYVVARSAISPSVVGQALRAAIHSLDPTLPVDLQTMPQRLDDLNSAPRFRALLLATFAAMGAILAAVGLFGLLSFAVAQRTREIGLRMALGATPAGILRLILGAAARWTAAGLVLGAAGALALGPVLRSMLAGVQPADPAAILAAMILLTVIAFAAALFPAGRAARMNPVETQFPHQEVRR